MTSSGGGPARKPGPPGPGQSARPESRGERRLISPFRCRVWTQHSRPEEQLTEQSCRSLRESIAKNGQHQPALGRPITNDPDYDIEIICGARRHAAALALGRDLVVEVRNINDADAYIAMYEENVERKDDCAYVQGQILRRALLSEVYSSQEQLARAFSLSASKASRLLMVAQLPSVIVAAFPSPDAIRESWGVELYQLWKENDPARALTTRARAITNRRRPISARAVYAELVTGTGHTSKRTTPHRSIPIYGRNGLMLYREQDLLTTITFTIPKAILTGRRRSALKQALARVLDEGDSQDYPVKSPPLEKSSPLDRPSA